ncbi:uncharacterized protein [Onthophagus taurus]|uniref:uncharacterized protein isoform X2 n=1 Tax=Onthophagus taurus TaxID=166361 RepID=UPI0039BEB3AD
MGMTETTMVDITEATMSDITEATMVDTTVGIMVATMVDITEATMVDITEATMVDITVDIMMDITVDIMVDTTMGIMKDIMIFIIDPTYHRPHVYIHTVPDQDQSVFAARFFKTMLKPPQKFKKIIQYHSDMSVELSCSEEKGKLINLISLSFLLSLRVIMATMVDITVDIMVGIMVDTTVGIMEDIMVYIMVFITVDIMVFTTVVPITEYIMIFITDPIYHHLYYFHTIADQDQSVFAARYFKTILKSPQKFKQNDK